MILLAEELTATTHDIKIRNTNKTVHVMNDKKGIWTANPSHLIFIILSWNKQRKTTEEKPANSYSAENGHLNREGRQ